jgi:hypothetical protein
MTYPDPPEGPDFYLSPSRLRRKAIPATCQLHGGPVNPTTLQVSKHDGTIVLDAHVAGSCVISLEEESATKLRDMLTDWLA